MSYIDTTNAKLAEAMRKIKTAERDLFAAPGDAEAMLREAAVALRYVQEYMNDHDSRPLAVRAPVTGVEL